MNHVLPVVTSFRALVRLNLTQAREAKGKGRARLALYHYHAARAFRRDASLLAATRSHKTRSSTSH